MTKLLRHTTRGGFQFSNLNSDFYVECRLQLARTDVLEDEIALLRDYDKKSPRVLVRLKPQ